MLLAAMGCAGLMIGHAEEGMLQAISGGSADEYQAPRLDVGVRRRVLSQGQALIHQVPGYGAGQKIPSGMAFQDRSSEVGQRWFR